MNPRRQVAGRTARSRGCQTPEEPKYPENIAEGVEWAWRLRQQHLIN